MKKIIFEKLTVQETKYILGAMTAAEMPKTCTTPVSGPACGTQVTVFECIEPALPEVPCVGGALPGPDSPC